MDKLCCIPCNESPNVDVDMECASTCCAANRPSRKPRKQVTKKKKKRDRVKSSSKQSCAKCKCHENEAFDKKDE